MNASKEWLLKQLKWCVGYNKDEEIYLNGMLPRIAVGKEDKTMATSTFERKIVISAPESLKCLAKVMTDKTPKKPISEHPFSSEERERCEELLKRCPLRSPR